MTGTGDLARMIIDIADQPNRPPQTGIEATCRWIEQQARGNTQPSSAHR